MLRVSKLYIIILIAAFLLTQLLGGILVYYIFYCLLFVLIYGTVYIFLQRYFIDAEVKLEERMYFSGDEVECLTKVKCSSAIAAPFVLVNCQTIREEAGGYAGEFTNLTLEEDRWIRSTIQFSHRGIYDFGNIELKIKDLFQVFELRKVIDCSAEIKVYPKVYELQRLSIGGKDIYQHALDIKSNNEDIFTIRDVRKYIEGDSLKRIHWKVSAKHGELYVKNSDNISGEEFTIFLDMNKRNLYLDNYGKSEEAMVELCISMVSYMLQKGISVKVFINSSKAHCMIIGTKEQLMNLKEFFVKEKSDGDCKFSQFILDNFSKLHRNNGMAIITSEIERDLCECLMRIKNNGYAITYFYSVILETTLENLEMLKNIGIESQSVEKVLEQAKAGDI